MSLEAITWAYKTEVGSAPRKAVLLVLANYADEEASSYPSIQRIAEMTELKTTAVKDALRDMAAMGVIRKEFRARANGSSTSTRYHLDLNWVGVATRPLPSRETTPRGSAGDPPPNTKTQPEEKTPRTMPAARVEASGRRSRPARRLKAVAEDEGLESNHLADDVPTEEPKPRRGPSVGGLAKEFERTARSRFELGDTRRVTNLIALRANISRWHKQDGIPLAEIEAAMSTYWTSGEYSAPGSEGWRRFINLFARMHAKATAPDTSDPAHYTAPHSEQENIAWTPETWLAAQQ